MYEISKWSDAELLTATVRQDEAFGVFYRRHVDAVLRFCARRGLSAAEAADLTAETFAAALIARQRYRPDATNARGWILGIAGHKLADRAKRWTREQRALRKLAMDPIALTDGDLSDYAAMRADVAGPATDALDALPEGQREAVHARVVEDKDYAAIGAILGVTETAARRRVSRGIAALHLQLKDDR